MLTKEKRVTKEKDFRTVLGRGRYVSTPFFLLKYASNKRAHHRYGFVVSTKVSKKAPVRNTIKRRMRAITRAYETGSEKGCDMVFIVKKDIVGRSFQEIKDAMRLAMQKAFSCSSRA